MSDQSLPPGALEALQRPSNAGNRSTVRKLSDFDQGVLAVSVSHHKDLGELTHKFDLLCPRSGCGSVILKAGIGRWVESESVELDITEKSLHPDLQALPAPPATTQWWLVTPNVMDFENIGFTRPVQQDVAAKKLKFLICAECDLGPLGWCEEGGKEFWLACSRVGYR
ncbi:Mss4-like protein [Suillus clintonianus]|uniref:Mss4-like protein n=1 Tax=Suillus clintonianus TaxID=1904413 RepID=UPI001B8723CF|nr:Mss4-like protein [Suillus clintonianus]KAG2127985.1 Mss4-like protein [Suillus clintonianus]